MPHPSPVREARFKKARSRVKSMYDVSFLEKVPNLQGGCWCKLGKKNPTIRSNN